MPTPELNFKWGPRLRHKVLVLHNDQHFVGQIGKLLRRDGRFQLLWVDNAFEAGQMAMELVPELIVCSPAILIRVVVFPHPDGPRRVKNAPSSIPNDILSTALSSPKYFTRFLTWRYFEEISSLVIIFSS